MAFTIILFIVSIAFLILIHEWGHFIAAKKSGMRVDEFGVGFPPRLFGIRRGETLYSINALPIGGFVRIWGEDGSHRDAERSFAAKSAWKRALVLAAGVGMNVVVAYVLFAALLTMGAPSIGAYVSAVVPASPAHDAGLQEQDIITSMRAGDERQEATADALAEFVEEHAGSTVVLEVQRSGETKEYTLSIPEEYDPEKGRIGVAFSDAGLAARSWYESLWLAVGLTLSSIVLVVSLLATALVGFVTQGIVPADLSGPVGVANFAGVARELGAAYYIQFLAIISINLAILNSIPFPALDGGRLLFLAIEKVKGSPVDKRVEGVVHTAGFVLLLLLIALITVRDVRNLL